MKRRLTDRFLQTVKSSRAGREVYIDDAAPGLEIRISPNGRKAWSIRFRLGTTRQRASYGTYPAISLREARTRAKEIAAAAARGIDLPEQEKRQREEEEKAANRPATLTDLLSSYIEQHVKPNLRQWRLIEGIFHNHVVPALGKKPLSELRRADLVELLDHLQNKKRFGAQTNRTRSYVITALNWAVEREFLEVNPFAGVKRRRIETPRDRVLSDHELRAIWHIADKLSCPVSALIKALILTGQRRDEIRCMNWSEIDLERALWVLPAARNKGGRNHVIPLSSAMLALIRDRPQRGGLVFATDHGGVVGGLSRLKATLDRESGITGWRFHDFRRTCASGLAALHTPQDVIDRVLGHAKPGLAGTYNRFEYLNAKRKALEAWAERVAVIVSEGRDAPNVITLPDRF